MQDRERGEWEWKGRQEWCLTRRKTRPGVWDKALSDTVPLQRLSDFLGFPGF